MKKEAKVENPTTQKCPIIRLKEESVAKDYNCQCNV